MLHLKVGDGHFQEFEIADYGSVGDQVPVIYHLK